MIRSVLVPFVLVVAAAALVLRAADWLPVALGGEPRGVRRFDQLGDLERATGARVRLPAYFPDTLGWPPARIRLALGRPPAISVLFGPRGGEVSQGARRNPAETGSHATSTGSAPSGETSTLPRWSTPAEAGRSDAELIVCETLGGHGPIPDWLTPAGMVLQRSETTVAGRPAEIVRVSEDDGRVVHDVRWESGDRTFRLRFSGPLEQLLLIAESTERGR